VRHDDLALVPERQVASPGQLFQALGDYRDLGAELLRELVCSGARPVSANVRYAASRRSSISMPPSSQTRTFRCSRPGQAEPMNVGPTGSLKL
jgi:hypothetical protein